MDTLSSKIISPPPPASPPIPDAFESILSLDYVNGLDFDEYQRQSTPPPNSPTAMCHNETVVIQAFKKVYDLFSVKPKKNRKIDFQQSRQVLFFLLQSVNPWNTPQILDILLTPTNREEQNMVKLELISFLTTNWSQALRPQLFRVIQHVSDIMLHDLYGRLPYYISNGQRHR